MKKRLIYLFSLLLLLISAACTEKKTYKIGIAQCSSDDWRSKWNQEVILESLLHDDVEIEIRSAHDDSRKQIEDIRYFADNGFDVIVVAPNEEEPLTPEIRKIYQKGIPIIIFDRNISDTTYTQRIWVDNEEIGYMAGEYAAHLLPQGIRAIEIYGLPGSTPAVDRSKGFNHVVDSVAGEVFATSPANWQLEAAEKTTDSLLRLYPDVNLIFAHNDRMAIGASQAAQRLGRDDIKIIGIDAAPAIGLQAVTDNIIDATFLYPTQGHQILREAINIAKGGNYEKDLRLPTASAVDSSNADILLLQNETIEEDTEKVLKLKQQLDDFQTLHNSQTALVYAIIAILILLFGVLFLVLRTFWAHRRHQSALLAQNRLLEEERDKQKELNEKLEVATQSKLVFFTNVSHDLRTPLTLISEPVAQLTQAQNLDVQQKNLIKIADKNVKILQRLINQILDFRKYEHNKLSLNLQEVNFNHVVGDWLDSFRATARKRDIKLSLETPTDNVILAIDVERMERVFFNLISNAMKYSPDNSRITVSFNVENDNLILKVADQGEGISEENINKIFDPFYQVNEVRPRGSGIGLSLTKAFIELHGGTISVESRLSKGSVFTVSIPIRHVAAEPEEVVKNIQSEDVEGVMEEVVAEREFSNDKALILVIDDNKDIREMVTTLLQDDYNVVTGSNGKDGIRKASKYVPDLIICDVMMPEMDGMECCAKLKSETVTSHIPVLMLTACSLDEQRVQGFENGADGYLSKPFSSIVLKAQIASLISNRKRIKDLLGGSLSKTNLGVSNQNKDIELSSGDIDNDFYNKFITLFEKEMGNPDLNVEMMASELGFERTQLYRKVKAITNYSPVELMRHLRLEKARALLASTDKSISEICYEVGFATPAYFTKCYREKYGETPSDTRK
ncbi:MAG: substrate-binding domain-containing protein [Muribaculaceae bacterium]|nr:substrate-binding domain-containing protein [Muribaculaceae bacterium]